MTQNNIEIKDHDEQRDINHNAKSKVLNNKNAFRKKFKRHGKHSNTSNNPESALNSQDKNENAIVSDKKNVTWELTAIEDRTIIEESVAIKENFAVENNTDVNNNPEIEKGITIEKHIEANINLEGSITKGQFDIEKTTVSKKNIVSDDNGLQEEYNKQNEEQQDGKKPNGENKRLSKHNSKKSEKDFFESEMRKEEEEEEEEEIQKPHSRHPQKNVPVIDHRLLVGKLNVYNWLKNTPATTNIPEVVEVRFKNTRKAFFKNDLKLPITEGDIVAVEATLGHDIGVVSLTGELVKEQIRLKKIDLNRNPLKTIYRKAKPNDIEKWQQAIALEHETMIKSRKIAADLNLNMKIGDVEYQGDKTKAIFYYIADERVDFRTLIKVLAETFRIRIEMKQIGARQEAGRIGGIGPCGRNLCCSMFISNFVSVSTSAARYQDISLNPQKLAGQCGKLKCCLNYEVDAYIDEQKDFPTTNLPLNTGDGILYHQKTDIFSRTMFFSYDKEGKGILIAIPVERVKEIIVMNRKGIIPPKAIDNEETKPVDIKYTDGVGEESLSRFDEKKHKKRGSKESKNIEGDFIEETQDNNKNNKNARNHYKSENRNDRNDRNEGKSNRHEEKNEKKNNRNEGRNDRIDKNNNRSSNNPKDELLNLNQSKPSSEENENKKRNNRHRFHKHRRTNSNPENIQE